MSCIVPWPILHKQTGLGFDNIFESETLACVCCAAVVADALAVEACVWTIVGGADVDPAPAEADVDAAADVVGDAVLVDIIGCALELPAELAVT